MGPDKIKKTNIHPPQFKENSFKTQKQFSNISGRIAIINGFRNINFTPNGLVPKKREKYRLCQWADYWGPTRLKLIYLEWFLAHGSKAIEKQGGNMFLITSPRVEIIWRNKIPRLD